jgi:hypothetical protein
VALGLIHGSYNATVFVRSRKLAGYASYIKINNVIVSIVRKHFKYRSKRTKPPIRSRRKAMVEMVTKEFPNSYQSEKMVTISFFCITTQMADSCLHNSHRNEEKEAKSEGNSFHSNNRKKCVWQKDLGIRQILCHSECILTKNKSVLIAMNPIFNPHKPSSLCISAAKDQNTIAMNPIFNHHKPS